jgi:FMN reductase
LADRLNAAVRNDLAAASVTASSTVIELRPLGRAIMDAMLSGFPSTALAQAFDTLASADGLIAVTPAFNASFGGLFKSFFDVLPEEALIRTCRC